MPVAPSPIAGLDLRAATTHRARLLGHAGLAELPPGAGLLLARTRSVHTFGMRFALDLHWLDGDGRVVRVDRAVAPRRICSSRAARAVIEVSHTLPRPLARGA